MKSKNWTMEQLESDGHYTEYHEPKVPFCFLYIFNCFLEIYNGSGESLTWTDIANYGKLRKIDFTQLEIDYIWKCNGWANGKIKELRDSED